MPKICSHCRPLYALTPRFSVGWLLDCSAYVRRNGMGNSKGSEVNKGLTNIKTNMKLDRNAFAPLLDITECFYYPNFGHKSHECQLKDNRL